jgi:hypothetical protein
MPLQSHRRVLALLFGVGALFGALPVQAAQSVAQCVVNAGNCGVNIAKANVNALVGAEKVLEFAAKHPNCVADIVATNFVTIGISSAMTTLAGTGVLKKDGKGSYLGYVYGVGARPMIKAISAIVPVPMLTSLLEQQGDEGLGAAFQAVTGQIPMPSAGAPNLALQLECGDAVASAGMGMVDSLKKVIGSAKAAVKTCSAAASCFATVLVDIVKDPVGSVGSAGEFLIDGADDVKDFVFGGCKNTPVQAYFDGRFKPHVNEIAYQTVWGGQPGYYGPISRQLVDQCVKDYDSCDSDKDTAGRQCVVMSSGQVQTDGNGWIAGKGLEQLVRTRELEFGIARYLDTTVAWADNEQPARTSAGIAKFFDSMAGPLRAKMPSPATLESNQMAVRKAAVRKILGVSGNSKPEPNSAKPVSLAAGSIGALMLGFVPEQGPANQGWSYKANEIFKQYYPDLAGNPKLLAQIDEAAQQDLTKTLQSQLDANGEAWNKALAKDAIAKIAAGDPLQKGGMCAYGDTACIDKVKNLLVVHETALVGLGRASNYAGMGAWGVSAPAYQTYLAEMAKAQAAAREVMAASVPRYNKAEAPTTAGPVGQRQVPQPSAPGLPQIGRTSPVGMPSLPTMGAMPVRPAVPAAVAATPEITTSSAAPPTGIRIPGQTAQHPAADEPPTARAMAEPPPTARTPIKIPGAVPPAIAPQAPPPPAATILPPAANAAQGFVAGNQAPSIGVPPVIVAPPFNEQAYRTERKQALSDKWLPSCNKNASCLQAMGALIEQRLQSEVLGVSSNNPNPSNKPAFAAFLLLQDQRYASQFEALVRMHTMPSLVSPVDSTPPKATVPKALRIPGLPLK